MEAVTAEEGGEGAMLEILKHCIAHSTIQGSLYGDNVYAGSVCGDISIN